MSASLQLESVFAQDGPLAKNIQGFCSRTQQLEMARAVQQAIVGNEILAVEAGTGTGKTFAYLVPALLAGGKVIISTGTKTLQDQLYNRDIPMVRQALKVPVTVALLKGRANYICHYHLERALKEGRLPSKEDAAYLKLVDSYSRTSATGDKSGLSSVPEDALVWPYVTSTRENCLGSDCPNHKECFVIEARKAALAADMVVVNHHLFFADVMLKDEGVAELLPACNTVIFDEAHQLPDVASLFFGDSVGTAQLIELASDVKSEWAAAARDFALLPEAAAAVDKAARDLRLAVDAADTRIPYSALSGFAEFPGALSTLQEKLAELGKVLESQAERSEGLKNCLERCEELLQGVKKWQHDSLDTVRWVEVYSQAMQLNTTPLSIADVFGKQLAGHVRAWIFTSATLAMKGNFDHYLSEMGITQAKTCCWESPFDYPNQAILYCPETMPDPNSRDYTRAVVDAALPVLRASRGRAFLLFTSLKAMRFAHSILKDELDYPLLLQGDGPKGEMLDRFRLLGNAVLLGSQSFWEGVDVRGEALSLVVIDRLPFSPPDDPVLSARIEKINREGGSAFMEYQLPHAVLTLKQGAGRLIRSETDRGVLMICDPRLISKSYGRRIWQSLPPMKRSRKLEDILEFFAAEKS